MGDDKLAAGPGDDLLRGAEGADTLMAGAGAETLDGGADDDLLSYAGATAGVVIDLATQTVSGGEAAHDVIAGIEHATGGDGDDTLRGEAGANILRGGAGADSIGGGEGADTLFGDAQGDRLHGGNGGDLLDGGTGADTVFGGDGADTVLGDLQGDWLEGGDGIDVISYANATGPVQINFGVGAAVIGGVGPVATLAGFEIAVGGEFGDNLIGGGTLIGGNGDDDFRGFDRTTALRGGAGNDEFFDNGFVDYSDHSAAQPIFASLSGPPFGIFTQVDDGLGGLDIVYFNTRILGGDGADSLQGEGVIDLTNEGGDGVTLAGGGGDDTISGSVGLPDDLEGGDGADTIIANDGADTLDGGADDDLLRGGAGADRLVGGTGFDTVSYAGSSAAVTVDLGAQTASGGDAEGDSLLGIEAATGSDFADTLRGSGVENTLRGGAGDDVLVGAEGNDLLEGGAGADTLEGGEGDDSLASGNSNDLLLGGNGNDALTLAGGGNTVLGGDGNDSIRVFGVPGAGDTIDGGAGDDTLSYDQRGFYRVTNNAGVFTIDYLGADSLGGPLGSGSFTDIEGIGIVGGVFDPRALDTNGGAAVLQLCFAAGTRITTTGGEVPIEHLQPGDRVVTADGGAEPVLWIGRRHVVLAGRGNIAEIAPVRIMAGALGDGVPIRDLVVSPDHCLFLDGVLVPARLLVNGTSIVAETGVAEVTWFHVELATHQLVLAEGTAAESWLDTGNRSWFANARVALLEVDGNLDSHGTGWDATRACAPLVHGGPQLGAIRAAIEARMVSGSGRRCGPRRLNTQR